MKVTGLQIFEQLLIAARDVKKHDFWDDSMRNSNYLVLKFKIF